MRGKVEGEGGCREIYLEGVNHFIPVMEQTWQMRAQQFQKNAEIGYYLSNMKLLKKNR